MRARSSRPSPSKSASTCVAQRWIVLKRLYRVPAAESIAVQHWRTIAIEHGQVEGLAIGNHAHLEGVGDRAAYKREIGGAIRPAGCVPDSASAPAGLPAEPDQDRNRDRSRAIPPFRSAAPESPPAAARICRRCCDTAPDRAAVSTHRSIRPSLLKSPGATSITPVRPSKTDVALRVVARAGTNGCPVTTTPADRSARCRPSRSGSFLPFSESTAPSSRMSVNVGSGRRRRFHASRGRIVDFRVDAPFDVLRNHPALLRCLDALKIREVAIRLLGIPRPADSDCRAGTARPPAAGPVPRRARTEPAPPQSRFTCRYSVPS